MPEQNGKPICLYHLPLSQPFPDHACADRLPIDRTPAERGASFDIAHEVVAKLARRNAAAETLRGLAIRRLT